MLDKHHFLYVEDDALSREIMSMILGTVMGVQSLTIFEDSRDFKARLDALNPQPTIIMLDIHMKPDDGFTLLDQIRSDPTYSDARVIALTASVMSEEVARLKGSGFDGAIAKPLDIGSFPDLITRVATGEPVWHIA